MKTRHALLALAISGVIAAPAQASYLLSDWDAPGAGAPTRYDYQFGTYPAADPDDVTWEALASTPDETTTLATRIVGEPDRGTNWKSQAAACDDLGCSAFTVSNGMPLGAAPGTVQNLVLTVEAGSP